MRRRVRERNRALGLVERRQFVMRTELHIFGNRMLRRRMHREHNELMCLAKLGHQRLRREAIRNLPARDAMVSKDEITKRAL